MRVATLSDSERRQYYRDMDAIMYQRSVLKTGHYEGKMEGLAEGRAEEKLNNARNLIANGVSLDVIAKSLSIPLDELRKL